jgi:hypothetical protein
MNTCEHELNLVSGDWVTDNEVIVEAECSLCKVKFKGRLEEDE